MQKYHFYISVFLIFISNFLFAQTEKELGIPPLVNFTPKDYNGGSQVFNATQDELFRMYFANTSGILMFNGNTWNIFRLPKQSVVRDILILPDKNIFVAATGDFGFLQCTDSGKVFFVSLLNYLPKAEIKIKNIYKIFANNNGVYFFEDKRIFLYKNNKVHVIKVDYNPNQIFQCNDNIFILLKNNKIAIISNTDVIELDFPYKIKTSENITLTPYYNTEILFLSQSGNNFLFKIDSKKQNKITDVKTFGLNAGNFFEEYGLTCTTMLPDSLFASGTQTGGILIFDKNGKILQNINQSTELKSNCVYSLFVDNNQNLWACLQKGIARIDISNPVSRFSSLQGLNGYILSTIFFQNSRYVGTMNGVYKIVNNLSALNKPEITFKKLDGLNDYCWDFLNFSNTLLAMGNFGLAQIDNNTIKTLNNTLKINTFTYSNLYKDILITGLYDGVAFVYLKKQGNTIRIDSIFRLPEIESRIRKIDIAPNGDIWISTQYDGLIMCRTQNKNLRNYTLYYYTTENGLPQNEMNFAMVNKNNIIVGTVNGIYKTYSPLGGLEKKLNFIRLPFKDLASNYDSASFTYPTFIADNLFSFVKNDFSVFVKLKNDSIDSIINNPFVRMPIVYKSYNESENNIWTYSGEGLFLLDKKKIKDFSQTFFTKIDKIALNHDSIIYKRGIKLNSFYEGIFNDRIVLAYKNNSILFEYNAIWYEENEATSYSYKLEGYDNYWSEWTPTRMKEYTNLSPGEYIFKVKAKNVYSTVSTIAEFKFKILKPWYLSAVAIIFYVISIIAIIIGLIKLYTNRLHKKNIRLEEIINYRTSEVQRQNKEILRRNLEITQQNEEIKTQAELLEQIIQELDKLSIVARETDNAIFIFDQNAKLEWFNYGFTKLYGYSFEEYCALNESLYLPDLSSNKEVGKILANCFETKKSVNYESLNITKNNKKIWVQTTLTPILDENGTITKLIAIDTDITKMKLAEAQILQKNEEIIAQKEALQQQNEEILSQRDELEQKTEQISQQNNMIMGSLRTALLIQQAILPLKENIDQYFDCFVLFKPRDIVSGDFYWFTKLENTETESFIFALADCTGHGVPGAFMSMIGDRLLAEIIIESKINIPNKILGELNLRIQKALKQNQTDNTDGMEICLFKIDKPNSEQIKITYSGAKIPLYYIKLNIGEMEILKADRHSIGGIQTYYQIEPEFTNKEIILSPKDLLIATTDGLIDQNNEQRLRFGTKRFIQTISPSRYLAMPFMQTRLETELNAWQENEPQRDDITVLCIRL